MKTLEQIKNQYSSQTLDGRDLYRLAMFIPEDQLGDYGLKLKEGGQHQPIPYTRENVLKQLERDVSFGFEKALNQRGISASMMFDVVHMWNWILEEGLEDWDTKKYAQYGLPLFKATAVKYGFEDQIEGYDGDESRFSSSLPEWHYE